MAMNKTQLVGKAGALGIELEKKETKESLIEKIATFLSENGQEKELEEFLDENGLQINEENIIVKKKKKKSLGQDPNTKAYHTIKVLQDESLAELSYKELVGYLENVEGISTTAASISWYNNWMKQKGMPVVPRKKTPKKETKTSADLEAESKAE